MEIATLLITAVMPVIVSYSANIVKQLQAVKLADNRVLIIRALVAVLAVIGSGLSAWVGDTVFDAGLVEIAVLAVFNAGAATWLYLRK